MKGFLARNWMAWLLPIAVVLIWEIAVRREWLPRSQSAAPSTIVGRVGELIANGPLLKHAAISAGRLLSGVALGSILGLLTAMTLSLIPLLDRLASPTIRFLSGLPVIIWLPFWIMLFGVGEPFKVGMVGIATYFLVHVNGTQAIRSVEKPFVELSLMYEKSQVQRARDIYLPPALSSILLSVRVALALGWIVIVFVEYASALKGTEGLGWFISDARGVGKVEDEFGGLFVLAGIAFVIDQFLGVLQRRLSRWSDTQADFLEAS